jgi:hypothetical protein
LLSPATSQALEGLTARDPKQVGLKGAATGLIAIKLTEEGQKHLLDDIFGGGTAAAHVQRIAEHCRPMPFEELGKGALIALTRPVDQPEIVHSESIA